MASSLLKVPLCGALPGHIALLSSSSKALVSGSRKTCEAARGECGKGRVVAIAHESLLKKYGKHDGFDEILKQWIQWLHHDAQRPPNVFMIGYKDSAEDWVAGIDSNWNMVAKLEEADIIVWLGTRGSGDVIVPGDDKFDHIGSAVANGAGLLTAMCPWGFCQITGADLSDECAQNRILIRAGLLFTSNYGTGGQYMDCTPPSDERQASLNAFTTLATLTTTDAPDPSEPALQSALTAVNLLPTELPPGAHDDTRAMLDMLAQYTTPDKLSATWQDELVVAKHPELMLAVARMHRSLAVGPVHALFPGVCAASEVRQTITRTDTVIQPKAWLSLNAWVNAGDQFQITIISSAIKRGKLRLRVGSHSDKLWHKDKWKRWPEVSTAIKLDHDKVELTHPWGGLLYLMNTTNEPGLVTVQLDNVVPSVHLDCTMDAEEYAEHEARLATTSVPWAEVSGRRMTFTVPMEALRNAKDARKAMAHWDNVVDSHRDLLRLGEPLLRRERTVFDRQISAGYLHSGYPIMAHLDQVTRAQDKGATVLDADRLRQEGSWGMYHELGHNLQDSAWTFSGAGEVTVNLFTLYSMHRLHGIEPVEHPWLLKHRAKAEEYVCDKDTNSSEKWQEWKRKPGLALWMYAQLQNRFGWDLFHQVFEHYRDNKLTPKKDLDKHQTFVAVCSQVAKHNLGPFFVETWCMPVSDRDAFSEFGEVFDGVEFWKN
eukprot:TRINITY_DN11927_c0_g5_i3.p1 TRINITY_DN11927_c0_g5~~TRINITY_DN11927_c0_g5_i3.p1  ORF type:complete len:713 (+),score=159.11 TRINITY_DN11927_c0_g5_i3:161-2299(+)